jgi:hypothetical protein
MLASFPVSMVNQKLPDLGIPNRFKLKSSRFRMVDASAYRRELAMVLSLAKIHKGCVVPFALGRTDQHCERQSKRV